MNRYFGSPFLIWPLVGLVFLFLYLPIFVLVGFSFNAASTPGLPWGGFTGEWYVKVWNNDQIMQALWNSVRVALGAVAIAVLLGVPASIAIDRYDFPLKRTFRRLVLLPIILPGVITSISLLSFFLFLNIRLSLVTLTIAMGTAMMCIVITEIVARLQQLGLSQEQAAYDMGATEIEVFLKITLPNIGSALFGSILITFSIAMDELTLSYLLIGRQNTLPIQIYSMLRRDVTPMVNAIATITLVISVVLVSTGIFLSRRRSFGRT